MQFQEISKDQSSQVPYNRVSISKQWHSCNHHWTGAFTRDATGIWHLCKVCIGSRKLRKQPKAVEEEEEKNIFRRWDVSQNKDALNLKWCSLAFLSFIIIKRTYWFSRITESKNPRLTFFTVIRHSRKLMWYLKCLFQIKTKQVEISKHAFVYIGYISPGFTNVCSWFSVVETI